MKKYTKLISVLLIAVLVVGALAACTKEGGNQGGGNAGTTAAGQVIMGTTTEANGDWGYAAWGNNATDALVRDLMDDCLTVTTDNNGEYVWNDSVVESYEITENADSKTWTMKIKSGLKYNNGEEIKAGDFLAWSLFTMHSLAQEMGVKAIGYQQVPGGVDYREGKTNKVEGLRVIDDNTVAITVLNNNAVTGDPILPYYYDLANAGLRAVNPGFWFGEGWTVKDDGDGAYLVNEKDAAMVFGADNAGKRIEEARFQNTDRVSAGPYYMVDFDTSSAQITLKVNENYCGNFEGQKPGIETLVITKVEQNTVMDMLATGQIDMYEQITDGDQINAALDLIDNGTIDASYSRFDRAGYGKIVFFCDFGPTQFIGVRHALAHLLDRVEFANTFCQGWGSVVNGPYGTAFAMAQDSADKFAKELDSYEYSLEEAVKCLEEAGFTLGADGNAYSGTGIRYKEVTPEEAGTYAHNIEVNGKTLMPFIVEWACSEGNSVSDLIATMLQENPDLVAAGGQINRTAMTFTELLNYMYRDASQGDQYGVPTYCMTNLATNYSGAYDMSYSFTLDPVLVEQGYNIPHILDEELDKLSMDMVYGVESGDYKGYLDIWQKFIIRWNQLLPELPLYSNVYVTVYPNTIEGYEQTSFKTFQKAILYAKWVGEK